MIRLSACTAAIAIVVRASAIGEPPFGFPAKYGCAAVITDDRDASTNRAFAVCALFAFPRTAMAFFTR